MSGDEARPPGADEARVADQRLAARAAKGDLDALDALVRKWQDRVFRLAHRFFRKPEDAEEIAQEVFLKMYRSLATWRENAPFEHWLLRIATNACRDELKRRRRRPATPLTEISPDAEGWLDHALRGSALAAADAQRARMVAADLLGRLPPKDRIVLVLMDLEGMEAAEVAAVTGSTRGAVRVRAMRARRALRRLAGVKRAP